MKRLKIESVGKTNLTKANKRTSEIAGHDWKHTIDEAILYIKNNEYQYFIKTEEGQKNIIIAIDNQIEYLKAENDNLQPDSLLNLPRPLSYDELAMQFQNQLWFLFTSCNAFDDGVYAEAIRIAATLRILLHDTKFSKSLLSQLNAKSIFFSSINKNKYSDDKDFFRMIQADLELISPLHNNPTHQFKPNFGNYEKQEKIAFDEWWNETVIKDMEGGSFSREKIILSVADQDGEAHVDPALEEDYYKLTRLNSIQHHFKRDVDLSNGFPEKLDFSQFEPVPSPLAVLYTIRQIAHEVLISKIDPEKSTVKWDTIYPYDETRYNGLGITFLGFS